jgi:hypothetical protein
MIPSPLFYENSMPLFKNKFRNTEGWYKRLSKKRSNMERFFDNRMTLYEITGRRGRSSKSPQIEISGSVRICHATVEKIYDRR